MSAAIEVADLSKNYGPVEAVRGVTSALDAGVSLDGLSVSMPSLEDVYLKLTEEQDS